MVPALAVDLSIGGLGMLTNDEITLNEFLVQLTLDDRTVTALVSRAGSVPGKLRGGEAWRTGGKFIGITADHWDALSRFVDNLPTTHSDKLRLDLNSLQTRPDDAARLLPKAALQQLLGELVKLKRLAPLHGTVEPLVKLRYLGKTNRQGVDMHVLRVESRVVRATRSTITLRSCILTTRYRGSLRSRWIRVSLRPQSRCRCRRT